ncbi:hypothetical protein BGZ70_008924 [Mortierella alpina]|uniref:Cytochrome P450 n=1 Tax=Mortierella alpina TaxID=64518 RepID=A0A9P6J2H2_MORAP|nr:hypothetical protein BGZ70_008924 [Mortierella alpina]
MAVRSFLDAAIQYSSATTPRSALIFVFLAALVYKYRSHAVGTRPRRDLKQPKGAVPFLGHMPLLATIPGTKLYDFFEKQHRELGPVWSISLPFMGRMIQGDDPAMIEYVLKTNFWNYEKGELLRNTLADIYGRTFFVVDGEEWKFQRKLAMQVLTVNAFREYTSDVFAQEGQKVVDYLYKAADEGIVVDFQELMLHYTLDTFTKVSVGKSFGCLDNIENEVPLAVAFDRLLSVSASRITNPAWRITEPLTGVTKTVKEDRAMIRKYYIEIIEERRRNGYHKAKKDLLQLVMEVMDDDGNPLSEDLIVDIVFQLTVAGRDTTAQGLSWMLYLLLRDGADKSILETLVQEVDDVLQGVEPTYDTYKRQKYAEACFNEAQRIYPGGPRNLKLCVSDDVLPGGIKIHKGEWFTWSPYVMGRSEHVWRPDVLEFKPSRWLNGERPSASKFVAFNVGPRTCPGQQFATCEALTVLGMILQSFQLELVDSSTVPAYGVSLTFPMLNGLPIRVHRRGATKAV